MNDKKSNSLNNDNKSDSNKYFQVNNPGQLWQQNKDMMDYQDEYLSSTLKSNRDRLMSFK